MGFQHLFSERQRSIVRFCAEEVKRQKAGPLAVSWMVDAWSHAWTRLVIDGEKLTPQFIEELGSIIEPVENQSGFRRIPIWVHHYSDGGALLESTEMMDWQNVERAISMLCSSVISLTPEEWYKEFENIHPFGDGNGRTGKILYAYLTGKLGQPELPPDFYGYGQP